MLTEKTMKINRNALIKACAVVLLTIGIGVAGFKGYGSGRLQAKQQPATPAKSPDPKGDAKGVMKDESKKSVSPPVRDQELVNLVDSLFGAKAEFGCDTLIRLIEKGLIKDKAWRVEILENVFRLAANAEHPFRKICALGSTDTLCGQLSGGLRLNMDELALRSRAVTLLLQDDISKARNLFEEIPLPRLPKSDCSTPWVYDSTAYYNALQVIISTGLTPEEKARGEGMFLLANAIREADSAQQIQALFEIIQKLDLSNANLNSAMTALVERMKKLDEHPRSFRIGAGGLARLGLELARYSAKRRISNVEFLEEIRDLMATTFHSLGCQSSPGARPKELPEFLVNFNEALPKVVYPEKQIPPISLKDYTAIRYEPSVVVEELWRHPAAHRQLMALKHLRFGDGHEPLKDDEKDNDTWRREATQILEDVGRWQGAGETSDAEVFVQRRMMYSTLVELVPRHHPFQELIMDKYIAFLEDNQDVADAWLVWFMEVDYLLKWRLNERPEDRKTFLDRMSNSRNLTLSLLGKTEKYIQAHSVGEPAPARKGKS